MTNRTPRFDNTPMLNWAILPSENYEQSLPAIILMTAGPKSYFTKRSQIEFSDHEKRNEPCAKRSWCNSAGITLPGQR
jgi:hypothetical protein